MLLQLVNILYVLVAVGIIAFVLLQQGSGAQAGSGFGGGASATVFGARGASNFLSKTTKWLAVAFFTISMGMAVYASKQAKTGSVKADLGVMARQVQVPSMPAQPQTDGTPSAPAAPTAPSK
jgi:preprotein translocase subunit SecG